MRVRGVERVRRAVRAARWRLLRRRMAGPRLLRAFAKLHPNAVFVEIGSNDGEHHDHLRPFIRSRAWSGIMVEPVPYVFQRLRRNYGNLDRVTLENVAIADRDGELPFYHLAEANSDEQVPGWYHGLGSFSREVLLGHVRDIPDIADRVVQTVVPSMTLASLCRKHGLEVLDLLLIDTEGYDYELIRSIDFADQRPRLMIYEHFHLSPDDRAACRRLVEAQGYETMEEGFDTWCLDTGPADQLTSTWRRTKPAIPGASVRDEEGIPVRP
jgi:FkbM family methyltransferase